MKITDQREEYGVTFSNKKSESRRLSQNREISCADFTRKATHYARKIAHFLRTITHLEGQYLKRVKEYNNAIKVMQKPGA